MDTLFRRRVEDREQQHRKLTGRRRQLPALARCLPDSVDTSVRFHLTDAQDGSAA
jgi:hypothetical protein